MSSKTKLECEVDGAPSQSPKLFADVAYSMTDGLAPPNPNHKGRSCRMFGQIPPRRTDGKIMLLSHTLTIRGSDVASFDRILPSGLGEVSVTERTDDGRMEK